MKLGFWAGTVAETTRVSPLWAQIGREDKSKRTVRITTSSLLIFAISHGFPKLSNENAADMANQPSKL